jgi:ABC-type antimicrobial peptide transport system permease subunit
VTSALSEARLGLRLRRRRALLTGLGIALAAAMLSAALVVGYGLGTGFNRGAARAHLADVIVRFNPESAERVAQRIQQLPDIQTFSLRQEVNGVELDANGRDADNGTAEVVGQGRRGYAIVGGRDLSGRPGEVVVDRGFASEWDLRLGQRLDVSGLPAQRIVGFAEEPDNVAYPLAAPQIFLSQAALGVPPDPQVNEALIWLRDPRYLNQVLVQARETSYGLQDTRFITRSGVRVLLDQAAGIVIDLLVALSVIALATAGVMLAASARAEVQRRLTTIGIKRAVGSSRLRVAQVQALEAMLVALPAATIGIIAGALATAGPSDRLLTMLNEPAAGAALIAPLAAAWAAATVIPALAAAWPAWRAAGRSPIELLRGAELRSRKLSLGLARKRGLALPRAGLATLGGRLVAARRTRWMATALTLGLSTAFVLLMLALASALSALETDPQELGKRYQLTASLPASDAAHIRRIPGVQAVAPRYEEEAVDSFSLGETIDVIAYPGDHTQFEAPPLAAGHRLKGSGQAEVGVGLADALGLTPGSPLVIQLESGQELRLKVAGLVNSLDSDGRVAYVPAKALLTADPLAPEELAIRLAPNANVTAVSNALGPTGAPAAGATARGAPLVSTLRAILTAVAVLDGLVCLYALLQACALTVQERRRTLAVLRAVGAGAPAVRRLLAGAVAALLIPAAALGLVLEEFVFAPALSRLAESYAALPISASTLEIAAVLAGVAVAGAFAVFWVARRVNRETVVAGFSAP